MLCASLLAVIGLVVAVKLDHTGPHGIARASAATSHPHPHPGRRASRPPDREPPRHRDPLGRAVASYAGSRAGRILAAVYDLRTGQLWTLGHGPPQPEASIVKLDIIETLDAQHHGRGSAVPGTDQLLAQSMIEDSDNAAATSLWDTVGGPGAIRSFNVEAGMRRTTLSACVECPGFPWPGWGLTTTVPTDQIMLLRQLVRPGRLLSDAQRAGVLRLMENVTPAQRWGVSGGVPAHATVALKNGWLPLNPAGTDWQINSVGWISGSGRDYLMAVLTTGNPTEQYGIGTIDGVSAMVWAAMS